MFRIIDLENLTQNQEAQTVFTFVAGTERHGITAAELFELLRNRAVQASAGKAGARKNLQAKRTQSTDQIESGELPVVAAGEIPDELSLS